MLKDDIETLKKERLRNWRLMRKALHEQTRLAYRERYEEVTVRLKELGEV